MWVCNKCGRVFENKNQSHSCSVFPIDKHFDNKKHAKEIFEHLVNKIKDDIGEIKIISLPCCIHLYGKYDFLATLPKKDKLEVRFSLNRILDNPRLKQSVPISSTSYKNCIDLYSISDVDLELIEWVKESYYLKD